MRCPNCDRTMDGICMCGDDTDVIHEFRCNYCYTYAMFRYNPEVTDKMLDLVFIE